MAATEGGMEKKQMQKERERLQTILDGYNAADSRAEHHPSLTERIARLDRLLAQAAD
jgi:hypothetical protein